MKFINSKTKNQTKETSYKKERLNPHKVWLTFVVIMILTIVGELGFFSWYFLRTAKSLDAITNPELKTNATKIRAITKIIDNVETSVNSRIGIPIAPSQKADTVLQ